jgi:deoxyribonuclease V
MKKTHYKDLLRDDLDFEEAKKIQRNLSYEISRLDFIKDNLRQEDCKIVVGADVHYFKKEKVEWGVACAVFWDIDEKKVIETSFAEMRIKIPYKPGFLGFREAKIINQAIQDCKIKADLLMCDGHGIIHPRNFGEAVHLGLALNLPSLGVAKNPFIGFSNWKPLNRITGEKSPIWLKDPNTNNLNNKLIGYAICLADSKKPVFISIGFKVSLEVAIEIALATTLHHRQPEPLFLADKYAKTFNDK